MTERSRHGVWAAVLVAALGAGGIAGKLIDQLTKPEADLVAQVALLRTELAEVRAEIRELRKEQREGFSDQRDRDREQDRRIASRPLPRSEVRFIGQTDPDVLTP